MAEKNANAKKTFFPVFFPINCFQGGGTGSVSTLDYSS